MINVETGDEVVVRIGGVEIQYFYTCKRELWFKLQQIASAQDDENLAIGRLIHENTYSKYTRRELSIGSAKIDLVISGKSKKIIEIKKSSKMILPTTRQLQYYLLLLEKQGIQITGEIRIPTEKKILPVSLTDEIRQELEEVMNQIPQLAKRPYPPVFSRKPYCKQCAYRDLCEA